MNKCNLEDVIEKTHKCTLHSLYILNVLVLLNRQMNYTLGPLDHLHRNNQGS